jgi:hypothetical protein
MPGLLSRDDYDSDAESEDDKEEREFYRQRSGREVEIGEHDGFRRTRRGQRGRRVIPLDRLGANTAYRDKGSLERTWGPISVAVSHHKRFEQESSTKCTHNPSIGIAP